MFQHYYIPFVPPQIGRHSLDMADNDLVKATLSRNIQERATVSVLLKCVTHLRIVSPVRPQVMWSPAKHTTFSLKQRSCVRTLLLQVRQGVACFLPSAVLSLEYIYSCRFWCGFCRASVGVSFASSPGRIHLGTTRMPCPPK